jgi:zinc protease
VPVWDRPPAPALDGRVVADGALQRFELDNGLSVIILEDHRLPQISVGVRLRRGAASEDAEHAGLANFTTSLMKRGAGDRDAIAFAEAVDALGASVGVDTSWDWIDVQAWGLSRDRDVLLEFLADVVLRPRFADEEAERTRGEILASLERSKDSPQRLEYQFAAKALYPTHRMGIPMSGNPESVSVLDAAAAREFHARMFIPNNALIYASGDIQAAELLERIGAAFGAWAPGKIPDPGPPPPAPTPAARRILVVDRPDLKQTRIHLAHEGIARTDPDRIAASLMNSVLGGGGFSSRLMQRVRQDSGLTYGVYSAFHLRRGGGSFAVSTFTRNVEVRTVIDLVLDEIEGVRVQPPTESEMEAARALAIGNFSLSLETSDAVLGGLVNLDVYGLPEDSLDSYRRRVRATTTADAERLALKLLHPERSVIVLVGPAEVLLPQIESLGPVEVVTP